MTALEIKKQHLITWIERCKDNLLQFKLSNVSMTTEQKIDFLRRQYYLLHLINNTLEGKSIIVGADNKEKSG